MEPNIEQDRQQAIVTARRVLAHQPIFLDTETTGLDNSAEIVDIALIAADGAELLNTLVRPGNPIPIEATRVHGITDDDVCNAPRFDVVWSGQLREVLAGTRLRANQSICIYNAAYDVRLIRQSLRQYSVGLNGMKPAFCVMELYAMFYGEWNYYHFSYTWQSLGNAAQQCHLPLPDNLHRALADAELARQVMRYMAAQELKDE